jgi:hypothetical protein
MHVRVQTAAYHPGEIDDLRRQRAEVDRNQHVSNSDVHLTLRVSRLANRAVAAVAEFCRRRLRRRCTIYTVWVP